MNINYIYNKKSLISSYDTSFNEKLYFEYETTNNLINYKLTNKKRYIVKKDDLEKVVYIFDATKEEGKEIIIYSNNVGNITLLPIGENIFPLTSYTLPKYNIKPLLYTFMKDYDCVIDVSKFKFLFTKKELTILPLYKKIKIK